MILILKNTSMVLPLDFDIRTFFGHENCGFSIEGFGILLQVCTERLKPHCLSQFFTNYHLL